MKLPARSEYEDQVAVFEWAALNECRWPCLKLLFGSIMGVKLHPKILNKMYKAGMKKGKPDIQLPVARGGYHSLWIELKRLKGGKVKEDQKATIMALRHEGNAAFMERGSANAIKTIKAYLKGEIIKK